MCEVVGSNPNIKKKKVFSPQSCFFPGHVRITLENLNVGYKFNVKQCKFHGNEAYVI
jgi:hypothetical protein